MSAAPIDPRLIMQAALDGELDAAGQLAFENALAEDPALAKDYERLVTLQRTLRKSFPRAPAPAALRAGLSAAAGHAAARETGVSRRGALGMAAALAIGVGVGAAANWALGRREPDLVDALIAGHRRALLAGAPVDIASNDRHNVRPWFDARIAISPPAPDLTSRGYPLVGGRVDVFGGAPAPTLVYKIREHLVSITALPGSAASMGEAPAGGFHALAWRGWGFTFWAVTDADPPSLEKFAEAFKATEGGGAETPPPR
jgi:anti-sigma factor RsiW